MSQQTEQPTRVTPSQQQAIDSAVRVVVRDAMSHNRHEGRDTTEIRIEVFPRHDYDDGAIGFKIFSGEQLLRVEGVLSDGRQF